MTARTIALLPPDIGQRMAQLPPEALSLAFMDGVETEYCGDHVRLSKGGEFTGSWMLPPSSR